MKPVRPKQLSVRNATFRWLRLWSDYVMLVFVMGTRNLIRNRRRSLLTAAAACVGTIGILFTIAFMNGLTRSMLESATQWGLGHAQIRPEGFLETRRLSLELADPVAVRALLKRLSRGLDNTDRFNGGGVDFRFSGRLEREGVVRLGARHSGVLFLGVEAETEAGIGAVARNLMDGGFFPPDSEEDRKYGVVACVVGRALATKLDVGVGDSLVISVVSRSGDATSVRARVRGIFAGPAISLEERLVFLRRTDLSNLLAGRPDSVGYFVLELRSLSPVPLALIKNSNWPPGTEVLTWNELEPMIPRLIELSAQFAWIAYAILMAGFAIILFEAVMMSVYERTREIGVMRAIGSGPRLLFWMVEVESILTSLFGFLIGLAFGGSIILTLEWTGVPLHLFSKGLGLLGGAAVGTIHPFLRFADIAVGLVAATGTALVAGAYPAARAVLLTPVAAIHGR